MLPAILLIAQMMTPDAEQAQRNLEQVARVAAAKACVGRKAADYAQHTAETAKMAASYAARSCAKEISAINPQVNPTNMSESLANEFELKVVEWRTRASKSGVSEWNTILLEIDPLR